MLTSMSLELQLVEHVKKIEVEELIERMGFEKDNLRDRYYYFDESLSIKGCWFSILFVGDKRNVVATTFNNCSFWDRDKQISVIKELKNQYGGTIYNPNSGQEVENFKNDILEVSKLEIAIKRTYYNFIDNIKRVKLLIEDVAEKDLDMENRNRIQITNLSILRHNTLLPFCVSILEDFLRSTFKAYLINNPDNMNRYFDGKKGELSYKKAKELFTGKEKLIDWILADYSFQNLELAQKAYTQYLGINLFDILRVEISYNMLIKKTIVSVISELIDIRHKIIHEAALHGKLGSETLDKYCYFLFEFGIRLVDKIALNNSFNSMANAERSLFIIR